MSQVNVDVCDGGVEAGLILVATQEMHQDDVLLSLPTDLGFKRTTPIGVMVSSSYVKLWAATSTTLPQAVMHETNASAASFQAVSNTKGQKHNHTSSLQLGLTVCMSFGALIHLQHRHHIYC